MALLKTMLSGNLAVKSRLLQIISSLAKQTKKGRIQLHCDAPYHDHPTNFFYKLANQDMQIWLTVTPPSNRQVTQQRIIENMLFCILWLTCKKKVVGWPR